MKTILSDLDFSNARIVNLPAPASANEPARLADLGGTVSSGTVTLSAGSFDVGKRSATVDVTGQSAIVASSKIWVTVRLEATADHSVDDPLIDSLQVNAGNIVAGTGFTVYLQCLNGNLWGDWKIDWTWI